MVYSLQIREIMDKTITDEAKKSRNMSVNCPSMPNLQTKFCPEDAGSYVPLQH
jgi:hypothetical protein